MERNPLHTPLSLGALPSEVSWYLQGDMPVPTPRWLFGPSKPAWSKGPAPPSPTPTRVMGTQGFWREEETSPTFTCPRAQERRPATLGRGQGLGQRCGLGRTDSSSRVGQGPPRHSCPSGCFCLFFGPIALCPCHASFKQKSYSCSLCPHPVPQEISYHCCICNLWIRGLSIYYYWLIIIIDYVNLPPVCLSRWVSG